MFVKCSSIFLLVPVALASEVERGWRLEQSIGINVGVAFHKVKEIKDVQSEEEKKESKEEEEKRKLEEAQREVEEAQREVEEAEEAQREVEEAQQKVRDVDGRINAAVQNNQQLQQARAVFAQRERELEAKRTALAQIEEEREKLFEGGVLRGSQVEAFYREKLSALPQGDPRRQRYIDAMYLNQTSDPQKSLSEEGCEYIGALV